MRALRRLTLSAVALVAVAAVVPAAQTDGPPAPATPKALAAVPRDGFVVLSVNVAQLWDDPAFTGAREWFAAQKEPTIDALLGVAPADLERVTLYVPPYHRGHRADPVVLLTTRRPYNEARVVKNLLGPRGTGDDVHRAGNVIRVLNDHPVPFASLVLADDRTLMLVPRDNAATAQIAAQLLSGKADGPLAPAIAAAGKSAVAVGLDPLVLGRMAGADDDRFLAPYRAVFRATSATFTADLKAGGVKSRLSLTLPSADDARRAGPVLEEAFADLAKLFDAEEKREVERGDHRALEAAVMALGRDALRGAKVEVKDSVVVASADGPNADALGKLIATLPKHAAAARRNAEAQNNLKQLLLGMHGYHDATGNLPGDVGPDRKTAWSWRVQLLPYLEQANLYQKLDMQKAWDDPRNKAILEAVEMPKVFEVPGRPAPKGHTYWRCFTLPKKSQPKDGRPWLVEGERGPRMVDITDGLSNTFAVVEAGEAVPWYAPDVLPYDGKMPLPQLGAKGGDGFLAGMGDGSVRFVRAKTDEATLRAAVTRDGGEVLALPDR